MDDLVRLLTVDLLRSLFRNLLQWRALYNDAMRHQETHTADPADGRLDTLTNGPLTITIFDLEALFEASQTMLSTRQAQAIRWFLVDGMFESKVAEKMGLSPTNPIGMYATDGLNRLIVLARNGSIPRLRLEGAR